jgi:hypothetical protein
MEDTLREKVRKMRDEVLIKILLQGILPKFKTELYLRMPEDNNDFEALCKQLIISEQILQSKESSEDKEITAVIAGITHHEKQQDEELNQQKLEIGNLKQKIAELETYCDAPASGYDETWQQGASRRRKGGADQFRREIRGDKIEIKFSLYPFFRLLPRVQPINGGRIKVWYLSILVIHTYSKKRHSSQEHLGTVAAVDHYDPRRTSSLDRHPRRDSRVQFSRPSSSQSRDSSFSRQQGRNSSYSRNRDQSPAHQRNSHNNKSSYSNNQPRFQDNDRTRRPNNLRYNRNRYPNQNNGNNFKWPNNNSSNQEQAGLQRQPSSGRRNITCFNCGKQGYIARECWTDMARASRAYPHNN